MENLQLPVGKMATVVYDGFQASLQQLRTYGCRQALCRHPARAAVHPVVRTQLLQCAHAVCSGSSRQPQVDTKYACVTFVRFLRSSDLLNCKLARRLLLSNIRNNFVFFQHFPFRSPCGTDRRTDRGTGRSSNAVYSDGGIITVQAAGGYEVHC